MSPPDSALPQPGHRKWLDWRWAVLALFAALVGFTSWHHEPWDDEAHAWLMARELPLSELVFQYIPYEGSPPLWHVLLWCMAKSGLGYASIHVLSALAAIGGTALLLWRSHLPAALKVLIPFGFWTAFQYAVVARSYVLIAPLLFLLAACWPRRMERPWRVVGILALLASTSAHGFILAGAIAANIVIDVVRQRRVLPSGQRRSTALALASLLAYAGGMIVLMRTPGDLTFPTGNAGFPWLALKNAARAVIDQVWTPYRPLTALTLIVSLWWFHRTRTLLHWLIPSAALGLALWLLWRQEWHLGIVYLTWLWTLWISFQEHVPQSEQEQANALPDAVPRQVGNLSYAPIRKFERLLAVAVFALAIGSQIAWTIHASWLDWQQPYSGSKAVAKYLRDHQLDARPISAVGLPGTAVQAYFDRPLFINWNQGQPPAMWWWSERFDYFEKPDEVTAARPAAIIRPIKPPIWRPDRYRGYYKAAVFPGHMYFQDFIKEENSYEIWLPIETAPSPAPQP